jgi:Na+-transporting NADH:ubiquinone oxidoreductase subunit E
MDGIIEIFFRAVFLENLALAYFLGMCTFIAVSRQIKTTLGLGVAVIVQHWGWVSP